MKLKSLIEDLFERILPHGVCQLIQVPTHAQQGVATKCLDHLYTTNPEKLSDLSVEFTGMSDHKLLKVSRYSKTLKSNPRYVRKRCFKHFNKAEFQRKVRDLPELKEISECQCASQAAELLTSGLTRVLDVCAPIRTIQNRNNYALHLSESTKKLMEERNVAQRCAAASGSPDEWRNYQRLRNQCVSAQRLDRKEWERRKLSSVDNSPA